MISTYQRLKDNLEYLKLKKASESLDEVIDFITANEFATTANPIIVVLPEFIVP